MRQRLFHNLNQLATDRWARRGVRMLLRASWLGASIWCVGLGGHLVWGWPLHTNILSALGLATLGIAIALLLRPRLKPHEAARRLDRRFHLDEQLATAVEVAATNPPPGSVAARLLTDSSHTTELLRRRIAKRQRLPWHDLLTLAMLVLVALGLWIIVGIGAPNLGTNALPISPLAEAQDPNARLPREPQPPPNEQNGEPGTTNAANQPTSIGDPQIVQALADALRDQGITRPAAAALDRGDLAGAARELRELADQASQLPQDTLSDLADRLRDAANQIGGRNQELTDQLENSADQLDQGGQSAAQALDDLARAIEQLPTTPADRAGQSDQAGQANQPGETGQAGQPNQSGQSDQSGDQAGQGNGAGQSQGQNQSEQAQGQGNGSGAGNGPGGEQRQADTSNRLGVEGQPVPLESDGVGDVPAQPSGPLQGGAGDTRPGFAQGDASSGQRVEVGADPLRVPIDERDVVQEYFQP